MEVVLIGLWCMYVTIIGTRNNNVTFMQICVPTYVTKHAKINHWAHKKLPYFLTLPFHNL